MSATFKNSKKKLSQAELRRFMNEHKGKSQKDVKKIESPLAKYNDQGQLTCILCNSIVRSEAVWTIHINAKQHKQNVEMAKKLKARTNNFTQPLKRPLTPPMEVPEKKTKGILKNAVPHTDTLLSTNDSNSTLPDDFFDGRNGKKTSNIDPKSKQKQNTLKTEPQPMDVAENEDALPEGFFDDPKLDAKARNQEYKDPIEEEWERFQKAIKEADTESAAIIAEDQEESTTERQIDEIDEQMKKLSRVLDLEKQKVEVVTVTSEANPSNDNDDYNEEEDEDFDEFLDWRSKKSFK